MTGTISQSEDALDADLGRPRRGSRRRVFFVLDSLNVGGTETQAVELARRLDPNKYEVTLACLRVRGPLLERLTGSSVSVMEFYPKGGMNSPAGLYQLLRMAIFLRRGRFDIVHAHDLWAILLGVPAAKLARVPVIVSSQRDLSHDPFYRSRREKILRYLQRTSDVVLTNAASIRDGLVEEGTFPSGKMRLVYNGLDLDRFGRAPQNRERLFPDVSGKLIVLVGNMHTDVKGHPWLIDAAPKVVAAFPDTNFVLVGDGASRKLFEERVVQLGLQRNFLFLGRRNDVPEILACCDIAVLPSRAEGLPNAVLEYLASGLPTIASSVGGNAEIVKNERTGLLVAPENSEALSSALIRLLRERGFATELGRSGQAFVRENFSFDRLVTEIDHLYSELLKQKT
jgi:glycosyltransferase involved in cell wall biosynthesis